MPALGVARGVAQKRRERRHRNQTCPPRPQLPHRKKGAGVAVIIGVDPHKASHTAVAIDDKERPLGELRVRSSADQVGRLLSWAARWPKRTWAVEGAGGLGYLLAQQLVSAGETVVDVQPKLGFTRPAVGHRQRQ